MNSRWRRRRQLNPRSHVLRYADQSHALLIALVLLGGTATVWAKKQSATQAVQPRQLSLLRVNVTGPGIRLLSVRGKSARPSPSARWAPFFPKAAFWLPPI